MQIQIIHDAILGPGQRLFHLPGGVIRIHLTQPGPHKRHAQKSGRAYAKGGQPEKPWPGSQIQPVIAQRHHQNIGEREHQQSEELALSVSSSRTRLPARASCLSTRASYFVTGVGLVAF